MEMGMKNRNLKSGCDSFTWWDDKFTPKLMCLADYLRYSGFVCTTSCRIEKNILQQTKLKEVSNGFDENSVTGDKCNSSVTVQWLDSEQYLPKNFESTHALMICVCCLVNIFTF